jgi:hypothetical protein
MTNDSNTDNKGGEHSSLNKILHDIRNIKQLSKENINDIKNMNHDEKMKIILTYNTVMDTITTFLELS